jgi:hypothetical protein
MWTLPANLRISNAYHYCSSDILVRDTEKWLKCPLFQIKNLKITIIHVAYGKHLLVEKSIFTLPSLRKVIRKKMSSSVYPSQSLFLSTEKKGSLREGEKTSLEIHFTRLPNWRNIFWKTLRKKREWRNRFRQSVFRHSVLLPFQIREADASAPPQTYDCKVKVPRVLVKVGVGSGAIELDPGFT